MNPLMKTDKIVSEMLRVKVGRRRAKGRSLMEAENGPSGRPLTLRAPHHLACFCLMRMAYGINWDVAEARFQSAAASRDMIQADGKWQEYGQVMNHVASPRLRHQSGNQWLAP